MQADVLGLVGSTMSRLMMALLQAAWPMAFAAHLHRGARHADVGYAHVGSGLPYFGHEGSASSGSDNGSNL